MAQAHPRAEVVGIDMTQWDLDTTEASTGGANVTWELDDLDIWGVDSHTEELSAISNFDFYSRMTHRDPISSPPKSPERAKFTRSPTETSVESLAVDDLNLHPEPGWHFSEPCELIHLRNMTQLAEAGATILPAAPSFYSGPKTIEDLVDTIVARALQAIGVDQDLMGEWKHE